MGPDPVALTESFQRSRIAVAVGASARRLCWAGVVAASSGKMLSLDPYLKELDALMEKIEHMLLTVVETLGASGRVAELDENSASGG